MRIYTIALSGLLLIGGAINSSISELRASNVQLSNSDREQLLSQARNADNCDDNKGGDNRCDYRGSGRLVPTSPDRQFNINTSQKLLAKSIYASSDNQPNDDTEQRGSGRIEANLTNKQLAINPVAPLFAESTRASEENQPNDEPEQRGSGRLEPQASATQQLLAESAASPNDDGDEAHRASGRLEA